MISRFFILNLNIAWDKLSLAVDRALEALSLKCKIKKICTTTNTLPIFKYWDA